MNNSEKFAINELIGDRKYLISNLLYQRGYSFVKCVLEMPEWEDPKFSHLLTSTIWASSYQAIQKNYHCLIGMIQNISIC